MSEEERFLIVNADDFGLTDEINRGIIEAHERGIVTSASLMVRYPAATRAAEYARARPKLSVGLHFDIAEWRCHQGEWVSAYQVVASDDLPAVARELESQITRFEELMNRMPTHLDSHQHVHKAEPARSLLLEKAARLNVPLRSCTNRVRYLGSFYGQTADGTSYHDGISQAHLASLLENLEPGWSELGCHPGYADNLDSAYLSEREEEVRVLCSAAILQALEGSDVRLRSFHDFPKKITKPGRPAS